MSLAFRLGLSPPSGKGSMSVILVLTLPLCTLKTIYSNSGVLTLPLLYVDKRFTATQAYCTLTNDLQQLRPTVP